MARGHLRKRSDDSWTIVLELERDPITGKRRQKWVTVKGTKREAEKKLSELQVQVDQGLVNTSSNLTVSQFLERWLRDYAEANCAPKTVHFYQDMIEHYITPYIGKITLDKLRPTHIVDLYSRLRKAPRRSSRPGPLSGTTRRAVHRTLHAALKHAVKWRLIPTNPADAVDAPQPERKEMRYFTPEQVTALMEVAERTGYPWHGFFAVALSTGMRLGELLGLRWQDIDLERGRLTVQQTVQRLPKMGIVAKSPKTAGSRRPIDLGREVVTILQQHRVAQTKHRQKIGPLWEDLGLVFPSERGTYIESTNVHRIFTRLCEQAGVPRIRLHDLRHTAATLMFAKRIGDKVISERLGHTDPSTTSRLYKHVTETMQREAADVMDGFVKRTKEANTEQ